MSTRRVRARRLNLRVDAPAQQALFWRGKVQEAKDGNPVPLANAVVEVLEVVAQIPADEKRYILEVLTGTRRARTKPGRARVMDAEALQLVRDVLKRCKDRRERAENIKSIAMLLGVKPSTVYDTTRVRRGSSGK